jgi:TetR/AcrR family transcriptional regulator
MVQISHSGGNEEKVKDILLAAQNRFGLYGFAKTTMQEIADDLGISKALLYYYYPDKEQLFRAVFEKEQNDFIYQLQKVVDHSDDMEAQLLEFLRLRMTNFKKFFNLGRASFEEIKGIRNIVRDMWVGFREKEQYELRRIFIRGLKDRRAEEKAEEIAGIYLDAVRGVLLMHFKSKDVALINDADYTLMVRKLDLLSKIFIRGIQEK